MPVIAGAVGGAVVLVLLAVVAVLVLRARRKRQRTVMALPQVPVNATMHTNPAFGAHHGMPLPEHLYEEPDQKPRGAVDVMYLIPRRFWDPAKYDVGQPTEDMTYDSVT